MHRRIVFTRPTATVSVSVTGTSCGLDCAHCGGKYLKGMRPPEQVLAALPNSQAKSILISGGCDEHGRVLLAGWPERFRNDAPQIRLNCHAGVADPVALDNLAKSVNVISYDYVSDDRIIRGVYGSLSSSEDYVGSFVSASNAAPTVPHITVGLLGPDEEPMLSMRSLGEIRVLADRREIPEPPAVVVIAFIPTRGTRMQAVPPTPPESVAAVISEAKRLFPSSPACLGCMRPSGGHRRELDALAVKAGADVIVMPSTSAEEAALSLGIDIEWSDECCVFPAMKGGEGRNE